MRDAGKQLFAPIRMLLESKSLNEKSGVIPPHNQGDPMSQQKNVIVSDIHVSNAAPYSWFVPPYSNATIEMLHTIANDASVSNLTLLGDIFDLWLYPVDVVPLTVSEIIDANPVFKEAMQNVVAKLPAVYYTDGNHDMGVDVCDLAPFSSGGKAVQPLPSNGLYPDWHMEHGNAPDMFNARDTAEDTIGGLPLGFFITRLCASADDPTAFWNKKGDIITEWTQKQGTLESYTRSEHLDLGQLFIEAIVDGLMLYVNINRKKQGESLFDDKTPIRFSQKSLDGKYTLGDIKHHYGSLLATWFAKYPDHLIDSMLTAILPNGLDWYANLLFSSSPPPKLVLLGHTHHDEIKDDTYANDGCCCRPSGVTYVVVKDNVPQTVQVPIG